MDNEKGMQVGYAIKNMSSSEEIYCINARKRNAFISYRLYFKNLIYNWRVKMVIIFF
jgi:hypothetical protein